MNQDELKDRVKVELREALAYFIERQKLVAQAMGNLGLDVNEVAQLGPIVWASNPETNSLGLQDPVQPEVVKSNDPFIEKIFQIALRASERNLPQSGVWRDDENNEWNYFLHGSGCLLINVKTREPIDWDCPDVNQYDRWKFMHHLMWQLSSKERANKLSFANLWVQNSLGALLDEITNDDVDM